MSKFAVGMVEEKNESSRRLLDEIEGDWESPKPSASEPGVAAGAASPAIPVPLSPFAPSPSSIPGAITAPGPGLDPGPSPGSPTERRLHAQLDAAADKLFESLEPSPLSSPSLADLDSGWGEDDEDDEEEEEEEEEEPELPDERLDPVAYAAAKKARDERIEARRQRRRAKVEAKKARRKARAEAARGKQKSKSRRAPTPEAKAKAKAEAKAKSKAKAKASERRAADPAGASDADDDARVVEDADEDDGVKATRSARSGSARSKSARSSGGPNGPNPSRVIGSKAMLSKTNQWMLAVAVLVFVAAAVFAAVIAK